MCQGDDELLPNAQNFLWEVTSNLKRMGDARIPNKLLQEFPLKGPLQRR